MNLGLDLWPLWSPWGLALIGLCAGSFVNVWVRRLPLMMARRWWWDTSWQLQNGDGLADATGSSPEPEEWRQRRLDLAKHLQDRLETQPELSLSQPRSHCPACGHVLKWHENLPVLGWLRLRGRCSACGTAIGWRYPVVELATAVLFVAMGWRLGFGPQALLWGAWAAVLLAMSLVDWDTTLLPDEMTLPLLWCGLAAAALGWTLPLSSALWGAVLGYGGLWCVVWAFERVTGKEAMGGGDLKLLAALGAWLGPMALLPVLFLASLSGAAVGLGMKARGRLREGRFVPFGPFLAGAGWVVAMWGHGPLLNWVGL
jgi:leader peptidase (prepilin peptidase)/N-methyltransferase